MPDERVSGVTLAIDAATALGTVAVLRDGGLVAQAELQMRGATGEQLLPAIDRTLREAGCMVTDVRRVICGEGPGSFTSLRIAGSIAKGIVLANDIPLYAVSSLQLMAAGIHHRLAPGEYLSALDAMRGEAFVLPTRVDDEQRLGFGEAIELWPEAQLALESQVRLARVMGPGRELECSPHARGVAVLIDRVLNSGPVDLSSWEPRYGRVAEAQARWEAAHGRPLA